MANEFKKQAEELNEYVAKLFSRAIQTGLLKGLEAAVRATVQDSGQAATHWMLAGANGSTSRPWQRKLSKLTYLRGTKSRAPVAPVGYRGDGGAHENEVVKFVRARELEEVLKKLISGRTPEFKFFFYNAVADVNNYRQNANILAAGQEAIDATLRYAEAQIAAANTRKVPLS